MSVPRADHERSSVAGASGQHAPDLDTRRQEPGHELSLQHDDFALGLIGWPLDHSFSPALHVAALRAAGLPGSFRLFPVPRGEAGEREIERLLEGMRRGEIQGLNVTIPHKQTVMRMLDALTPEARAVGAVNTIAMDGGRLLGDNTDAPGFLADLQRSFALRPESAIVLGAGGSARAVVFALARQGWRVHVAARRRDRARRLADDLSGLGGPISPAPLSVAGLAAVAPGCGLIVNCTPVGMAPNVTATPWPKDVPLPERAAVYDLVYNPRETALVREARARGLLAVTGIGMLIEQAALSFERWTGRPASREAMGAAVPT